MEKIKMNKSGKSEIQWFTSGGERKCLITKYDDVLGWYLVLEMETNSISSSFQERIKDNMLFMLFSLVACIIVTMVVFFNYDKRIVTIENMDELTGLPNRKLFSEKYSEFIRKHRKKKKTLFMLDIDYFKEVNDSHGHMFGNAVLVMVADELRKAIKGYGIAARWGGDEFIGVLSVEPEEARQILRKFMDDLKKEEKDGGCSITVSVGMIEIDEHLGMDQLIRKADEVLYCSKENGRDQITAFMSESNRHQY